MPSKKVVIYNLLPGTIYYVNEGNPEPTLNDLVNYTLARLPMLSSNTEI